MTTSHSKPTLHGWHRVFLNDLPHQEIWWIEQGIVVDDYTVESFEALGYRFEPVVVLAKDDHARLSVRASQYDGMCDQLVSLRDVFFEAVPEVYNDGRFEEMMGSPSSVIHYVMEHLTQGQKWDTLVAGEYVIGTNKTLRIERLKLIGDSETVLKTRLEIYREGRLTATITLPGTFRLQQQKDTDNVPQPA